MPANRSDRLGTVSNVVVMVAAVLFLFSGNGPVGRWLSATRAEREAAERIEGVWERLVDTEARIGPENAPRELVVFTDYQCPFCKENEAAIRTLLSVDPGVAVVYRHHPIGLLHPGAEQAALAAICAEFAGYFEVLHDFLFRDTEWEATDDWGTVLGRVQVPDAAEIEACIGGAPARERLDADLALAQAVGVSSTPFFLTKRRSGRGLQTVDQLTMLLQER